MGKLAERWIAQKACAILLATFKVYVRSDDIAGPARPRFRSISVGEPSGETAAAANASKMETALAIS